MTMLHEIIGSGFQHARGKRTRSPAMATARLRQMMVTAGAGIAMAAEMYPIDFCTSYTNLCGDLLSKFQCNGATTLTTGGCATHAQYAAYDGSCKCGTLSAHDRLEQQLVYHEIDRTIDSSMVKTSSGKTDFCTSFVNTCNAFLAGVSCPSSISTAIGCSNSFNYTSYHGTCSCGGIDGAYEARNSIVAKLEMSKVHELTEFHDQYVKLCPTFENICGDFLENIDCPASQRVHVGCTRTADNDYTTYQGMCQCGNVDVGDRVRRLVIDKHVGPKIAEIAGSFINTDGTLDFCNTFTWSCDQWLNEVIQCPSEMVVNENNCGSASGTDIATFQGTCTCGAIKAHQRIQDIIIDTELLPDLPYMLCGLNGQCHPRKDVVLTKSKIPAGGVFGILVTVFIGVILSAAFVPQIWTCGRKTD